MKKNKVYFVWIKKTVITDNTKHLNKARLPGNPGHAGYPHTQLADGALCYTVFRLSIVCRLSGFVVVVCDVMYCG